MTPNPPKYSSGSRVYVLEGVALTDEWALPARLIPTTSKSPKCSYPAGPKIAAFNDGCTARVARLALSARHGHSQVQQPRFGRFKSRREQWQKHTEQLPSLTVITRFSAVPSGPAATWEGFAILGGTECRSARRLIASCRW
ncbi:cyclic nucleotide-gated cation channel alpha-3 [Anopheles sinensis]|uniref:Cyclic nucleotide-gated cation channel alpha-3 n=1 Tax=Anopheles sinensis TaxID=74873 RepID=A0A084W298_ANOSI|nr:cyclic nucleotide-gated cation channel alpha-3 [Anopheles sinensis]